MELVSVTPPHSSCPESPSCISHSSTCIESTPSEKLSAQSWIYFGQIFVYMMTSESLCNVRGRICLEQEKKYFWLKWKLLNQWHRSSFSHSDPVLRVKLAYWLSSKVIEIHYDFIVLVWVCPSHNPFSSLFLFLINCILDMTLPNHFIFLKFINFSENVDNILQSLNFWVPWTSACTLFTYLCCLQT